MPLSKELKPNKTGICELVNLDEQGKLDEEEKRMKYL